jgi:hypothetical protein
MTVDGIYGYPKRVSGVRSSKRQLWRLRIEPQGNAERVSGLAPVAGGIL